MLVRARVSAGADPDAVVVDATVDDVIDGIVVVVATGVVVVVVGSGGGGGVGP